MRYVKKDHYEKLEIDFEIPDFLSDRIDDFVEYLNTSDGLSEDCYRTEIGLMIRDAELPPDKQKLLKDYYEWGGIYKN
ncbi:MAG: hypothetical protein IJI65_02600 [Lachnospiraceae bacterium]|nr:hypothetical protein [Lachnospiraceae bacterium]